jgi:SRSO17 transposase
MIIDKKPPFLQAFFEPFRQLLSKPQFHHLWTVLLAWIGQRGRRDVLHLAQAGPRHGHRTSIGRFFTEGPWDGAQLLNRQVTRMLRMMRPEAGEPINLIIDDTRIAKRARKMYGVGPMWVPTRGAFTYGHMVVTAAVEFRGVIMPWRFELWASKQWTGKAYRKSTQIAAEFIRAFQPPKGLKVHVLFDAFYLTSVVVNACKDRGFVWFSVASKNRTLQRPNGRPRRRLSALVPGLLRHQGHNVRMKRARGWARFRLALVEGKLKGIGWVRIAVRKRPRARLTTATAIATNARGLSARKIASIYERRWRIEELFKELRSDLGLGEYQVLSREGILHHLHLCGLAHLLLTHHSLEAVAAQARKAHETIPLPSLNRRLESLRRALLTYQLTRILRHEKNRNRRKKLEQLLLAA